MNDTIASYSFLPWLRQGLSNSITQADNDMSVKLRASINVDLTVSYVNVNGSTGSSPIPRKTVEMYGPGDIVGIDTKAIIKTEPRNWITNFEPNYLACIDFYEEDFCWRYTPARAFGDRLRPWLTLVVLKEDEFENGRNTKDKPLPFFKLRDGIKASEIFPAPAELWAWAHVHVNTDLANGAEHANIFDPAQVTSEVTDIIMHTPDHAYSRLICPRKLEANVAYHAFLIPTFESGRLAGLGYDIPVDLVATQSGWLLENAEFPYYYRWYFKTGNVGDFEYLVNLLQPKPADKTVGVRNMDVLHPGSNLPAINDVALNGILKMGGALRVPFDTMLPEDQQEVKNYDEWDEHPYPHEFTEAIATRINLADDYVDQSSAVEDVNKDAGIVSETDPEAGDPDPVITSPLYGRWHALQQRLLKEKDDSDLPHNKNWVHELNLDPRFRTAAGFGTKVLRKNQEEYMNASWQQVGKIIEANNRIRFAQLAKEVSVKWYSKHLEQLDTEKAFVFTTPVQKRITYDRLTVRSQVQKSRIPTTVTSGTFRSIVRPGGSAMNRLFKRTNVAAPAPAVNISAGNLIERINEGLVIVAPPKVDPPGAIDLSDISKKFEPADIPAFIKDLFKNGNKIKYLPLVLLLVLVILMFLLFFTATGIAITAVIAAGLGWFYSRMQNWENRFNQWKVAVNVAETTSQQNMTPAFVDQLPLIPGFVISEPVPRNTFTPLPGATDSIESKNYKQGLRDSFALINMKFKAPEREKIDLSAITAEVVKKLDPAVTIPKRVFADVKIPPRIWDNMKEQFAQVMAYPILDIPMYRPLAELSSELFLPNINKIEQNSITLLENNQKFIESYMVGINHEMSRELLWREFPTDQRGTYFRQFWEVAGFMPPPPEAGTTPPTADELTEQLYDIPRIHLWSKIDKEIANPGDTFPQQKNELGQHNNRSANGKVQLVLVIRGELLKKYPTAVIYAQKADWGNDPHTHQKDVNAERVLVELTDTEKEKPPTDKLKTPLFEAKVDPDIYFFGFDLDAITARGDLEPDSLDDNSGWFFVIKERPGEPRFGLDIDKATNDDGVERFINWNNLSWPDVGTADGACIQLNNTMRPFNTYDAGIDGENTTVIDDEQARWNPDTNAAQLAYILYQVPILVAVHASRMLPKNEEA